MIALARFQVEGYVRSLRVMHPVIVVALVMVLVLFQGPGGPERVELSVGSFGDVAAFMFPIWAWTARALLDTQPDEQRALSATAARHRWTPTWAGLIAAYGVNLCLGVIVLAIPLVQALQVGAPGRAILAGCALSVPVALAGTLLGAWTSRAVIPDPGVSLLALLGGATAAILLGLGRLSWLSVPMTGWLRAAHDGPDRFLADFPGLVLHLALWSAVVGAAYAFAARLRH
ncbi:hypothetical protein F8568_003530 [Actinomadura sp. LD22]|uniref:Uncharacterized protein n=1 Tax=Actinomadura physcomitrii TaxID=2650748 RepID=A0A6I4M5A3_9ACTN|nr:hypothetical protein [Actinomadura physcomitrii]MVZ99463.1 hypothetical protein [Actinomadura physcomitrii]